MLEQDPDIKSAAEIKTAKQANLYANVDNSGICTRLGKVVFIWAQMFKSHVY